MSPGAQWLDGRLSGLAERNRERRLARLGKRLDAVSGSSKSEWGTRRVTPRSGGFPMQPESHEYNEAAITQSSGESLDALRSVIEFFPRETPPQRILSEIAKGLADLERGMVLDVGFWIGLHIAIEEEISRGGEDIV